MLLMISNSDVGQPTVPGAYQCNGNIIQVDAKHIAAWATDSEALISTILCTRMGERGPIRLALGGIKAV